ncbi:MAG: hypothetical protein ACREMV_12195, partial [Gemmatimonadales bacterium]
ALVRGLAIRHDQRTPTPASLLDELSGAAAPRRRYSGDEVEEIVRRASEIEATSPTAGGALTIGGVEALAAEVGIAPEVVRAAASSLGPTAGATAAAPEPVRANPWIGGPTRIAIERIVDGELPDTEYSVMVDETRRVLRNVGQVSQLGRSFSWSASPGATERSLEIVVSVRGGRTRITIQENLRPLVGQMFGGIGGGMGGGGMGPIIGILIGGLNLTPLILVGVVPLWLATTYATARTAYGRTTRRRVRELEGLADRLANLARELIPVRAAVRGAAPRLAP